MRHSAHDLLAAALDPARVHDREYLNALLALRNRHPGLQAEVDAAIDQAFVRPVAMLVLDLCGFSRITAHHGIIHFLAFIQRMEQAARPAIAANGGEVVKQEADNLFAVFTHPQQALEAALDILRAIAAMNAVQSAPEQLQASIGIGYGATLVIAGKDLYGHEMNLACKLGEDIAGPGEVLLTEAAGAALDAARYQLQPLHERISGVELAAHRFVAYLHDGPLGAASAAPGK